MIRILVASCIRQDPAVLRAALRTWKWQSGNFQCDFAFVDDNDDPSSKLITRDPSHTVIDADPKPDGARYNVGNVTHDWSLPMFGWLAIQKQKLIDLAKAGRYDAIWIVDSDLLCSPDTLSSLWHTRKDVVSAVFWTKWTPESPPLPQVWMAHPYEFQGRGVEAHEFLGSIAERKLTRVAGLGACTLIRANVFDRIGYWPLIEGLPTHGMWQGEDRHFCVRAERNHVELWADPWPDVWHCYRPEDRASIDAWLERFTPEPFSSNGMGLFDPDAAMRRRPFAVSRTPNVGDLVSFTIEPLEEPNIAGYTEHIRGRLGAIRMLPQLERELQTMRAGDEALVKLRFPLWWEIPEYRGQAKMVRLKLLHVKPFAEHPTLGDTPAVHIGESFMENAA